MARRARQDHSGEQGRDARADRAREVGLFRYALIRTAADPALSTRQRGRLVRDLAAREHTGPFGQRVRVSRVTIDRWILVWRRGGFDALLPSARSAQPRTAAALLELAAALKREVPARTAAQVRAILLASAGAAPSQRTLQRHFVRLELNTRPDGVAPRAFGRFEAAAPNERWTGDALHGPVVAGRKTYLFAFIDDHSRALVGYRWGHSEDTVRLEAALRAGLASRGVPQVVYLDNGSAMVSSQLLRALAILGITLTHSKPGQPAGRGKIEKFFRTVREQFLVELAAPGALAAVEDLVRLNELFAGWVETVYHARVHSETGQRPLERFLAPGPPSLPTAQMLHEAFLWSQRRRVTKTATISLHGNRYEVDAALVGRTVEVVFDPFDLTTLQIRYQGRSMGIAVPHRIGRHVHPDARPELPPAPVTPTGIDYLALITAGHRAQLAARINYTDLPTSHPAEGPAEGPAASNKIDNEIDEGLEAELASFAALRDQHRRDQHRRPHSNQVVADGELPGQLDLTSLTDEPDEPDDHHSNDDSRQGPR
jgi:putative transposase